ncbi:FAD-dependent oxidoreductase [Actinopolyspora saharensis]|uniref:FAD-dependent oxidoreductase n=1 Tax=Actinopolyspora saharensis TaxID=995062 RepID=UPI003F67CD2B
MSVRNVLVAGAGIAGSTLAYWLARYGIDTTVVERAAEQRSSGSPVDVRGPALPVVEQMNLLTPLREAATLARSLTAVNSSGGRIGWIPSQTSANAVEIPRSSLAGILARAASAHAEVVHGDSVLTLHDDGQGVEVTFERSAPRRFDLVVGADGLHSRVRRLAFGLESQFLTHLGLHIATMPLQQAAADRTVLLHNAPGRAVAVHPTVGSEVAAFVFRAPPRSNTRGQDMEQNKQLVIDAYSGMGWRVPELLDRVRHSGDLYCDSVSRARLDSWSRGRIVLVGDAANCVSLLGEGSSTAIAGAATLAHELGTHADEPAAALRRYEHAHRKRVGRAQRGVALASRMLVPATRAGTAVRDVPFRMWPVLASMRGIERPPG